MRSNRAARVRLAIKNPDTSSASINLRERYLAVKPHGLLVSVSSTPFSASTSDLSTSLSGRGLQGLTAGIPNLGVGFPLICFQRLSRPHLATRRCGWRHNRYTSGASDPVLSYWGERLASLEHPRHIRTELSHDVLNPAHVPL